MVENNYELERLKEKEKTLYYQIGELEDKLELIDTEIMEMFPNLQIDSNYPISSFKHELNSLEKFNDWVMNWPAVGDRKGMYDSARDKELPKIIRTRNQIFSDIVYCEKELDIVNRKLSEL